jgi:TonB family protein
MHFAGKHESLPWRSRARAAVGIGLALLAFHLLALQLPALAQNATEDQVKAAYLLNFAKLADWHRTPLPDGPSPLVIGVSGGDEEFLNVLKAVVAGKIIDAHPLVVKSVSSEEEMKSCRIVFFRASGRKHTEVAVDDLAQAGVLLVGEHESFLRQGGMINLVKDHGSVRFEVNSDALDRSDIHFSSKILALAKASYGPSHPSASPSPVEGTRQLERNAPPEYPDIAKRMNLTGTVQVQATVKPDGTVKAVTILGGHPLLADALSRAVMQWKYQPGPKETLEVVKFSFVPQ